MTHLKLFFPITRKADEAHPLFVEILTVNNSFWIEIQISDVIDSHIELHLIF